MGKCAVGTSTSVARPVGALTSELPAPGSPVAAVAATSSTDTGGPMLPASAFDPLLRFERCQLHQTEYSVLIDRRSSKYAADRAQVLVIARF